jgi:hypothetical protein
MIESGNGFGMGGAGPVALPKQPTVNRSETTTDRQMVVFLSIYNPQFTMILKLDEYSQR